jgi:hypothetical protein
MSKLLNPETELYINTFIWDDEETGEEMEIDVNGNLLVDAEESYLRSHPGGTEYSVVQTDADKFFFFAVKFGAQEFHICQNFNSFDEMKDSGIVPPRILSKVADLIDVYYEEFLDI